VYPVPDDRAVRMGLDVDGSELIPHNGKGGAFARHRKVTRMSKGISGVLGSICDRYGIDALYVFGSRAAEAARAMKAERPLTDSTGSDVDIGVLPRQDCSLDPAAKVRLMAELEDAFGIGRVDLVSLTEAPPFLALEIVRGELLYEADPDRVADYELFVLRRAADLAPFERERVQSVLAGTAT
jgi:predicted nucleotidyltransferase